LSEYSGTCIDIRADNLLFRHVGMVSRKDRRAGGPDLREWFAGVHQAGFRGTAVRLVVPAGPLGCLLVDRPGLPGRQAWRGLGAGAWDSEEVGDGVVTVFACGDVMPGRGVDQILPHPGDPELREPYVRDARAYVDLAEDAHGPIPRPVSFGWPWGDALRVLDEIAPDVRVINLETSITASRGFAPGKAICYRMSPGNVPCVAAARPDVCALANNHVLDFGRRGLADTVRALSGAGLRAAGAGPDSEAAGGCPGAGRRARRHHLLRHRFQRDPGGLGRRPGPARGQPAP
jgi:hypothetical protein